MNFFSNHGGMYRLGIKSNKNSGEKYTPYGDYGNMGGLIFEVNPEGVAWCLPPRLLAILLIPTLRLRCFEKEGATE